MLTNRTAATLLVAALAVLVAAAPAHAGWKLDRSKAIAAKVWHDPCPTGVTVLFAATVDPMADAEADPATCTVTFQPLSRPRTFVEVCSTMIHEYGHLAGLPDSDDPASVMFGTPARMINRFSYAHGPSDVEYVNLDRRCADRGRTYLGMKPSVRAKHEFFE